MIPIYISETEQGRLVIFTNKDEDRIAMGMYSPDADKDSDPIAGFEFNSVTAIRVIHALAMAVDMRVSHPVIESKNNLVIPLYAGYTKTKLGE